MAAFLQAAADSSMRRCEELLLSFQEHTSLLSADSSILRTRLTGSRRAASMQDWINMISKFR